MSPGIGGGLSEEVFKEEGTSTLGPHRFWSPIAEKNFRLRHKTT
jgi:hypothetical protein